MTRPSGWAGPTSDTRVASAQVMWGYTKRLPEKLPWASSVLIGLLDKDAEPDSTLAAKTILQCILTSGFYTDVAVTLDEYRLSQVRIDGTPAVQADALISFRHPQLTTRGSRLRLIIVETAPERAIFFSAAPKENAAQLTQIDQTVASLSVVS